MENSRLNCNTNQKNKKPHAILVPLALQGHLIPFVQLAIKLASNGFSITFLNTEHIHRQISLSNATTGDIFTGLGLDIEYVTVSDGLPVQFDRSLNHDQWLAANIHCLSAHVEVAVANIVTSRPFVSCLIADTYYTWPSQVAKKFGLLCVSFWTESAMVLDIYFHVHLLKQNGHLGHGARKDTINYLPGIKSMKPTDLTSYLQQEDLTTFYHQFLFACFEDVKRADFILSNSVQELEPDTTSVIQTQKPFFPIGPLFPTQFTKRSVATNLWLESDCIKWLDTKPHGSVLYISFGSYAHISKEDLWEIANGIKLSGVNFIWVLRPDVVSSDEPDSLPVGYQDEVSDRGMIVTWTCQNVVLSHTAIGGFLTHCGWNSTLESIWCEVPLLCFPLLTDQFTNRKLIVDDWKIGRNLCHEKAINVEEVCQNIKLFLSEMIRCELKEKIKEVKRMFENATMAEGSSQKNLNNFINEMNLAAKKKAC